MEALGGGNAFDGIVDFILNGLYEALTLLVEFAFGTEVFLLQICCFLFFGNDGLFAFFLLRFAEEDAFVLIILIECLSGFVECFDFSLPSFGGLVELFVCTFVGWNVAEDVFHIYQRKLLCLCLKGCTIEEKEK